MLLNASKSERICACDWLDWIFVYGICYIDVNTLQTLSSNDSNAYENSFENKVVWIIYLFVVSDYTHHTVQSISVQWTTKKTNTYIRFIKEIPLTTLAIHVHSICSGFRKSFAAWQFHFVKLGFEYGITNYKSKPIKIFGG